MSNRGRGRRPSGVREPGPSWRQGPWVPSCTWPTVAWPPPPPGPPPGPGRAAVPLDGAAPVAAGIQDVWSAEDVVAGAVAVVTQDSWGAEDVVAGAVVTQDAWGAGDAVGTQDSRGAEDDGRESPASSSSGYGSSCQDVSGTFLSSLSEEDDDVWREREVYASTKYHSLSINAAFNYWSPISEDDELLDELKRSKRRTQNSVSDFDSEASDDDVPEIWTSAEVHDASFSTPCSGAVSYGDAVHYQNALYAPGDAQRCGAVLASNMVNWGIFHSWLPMPTMEEALLLAAIAQEEEKERRRISELKKAQKMRQYRFSRSKLRTKCI